MKKIVILALIAVMAFTAAACTTYDKNVFMKDTAQFKSESHRLWTRPSEVAYEIIGDVEGTAEYSLLFGILPLGDAPAVSFNVFGFMGNQTATNPGVMFASYDACRSIGADGMYITSVYNETKNGLFVDKETYTVKGKALKLVDLGTIDQERADTVRYLSASGGLDKSNLAPNLGQGGVFGSLGDIFVFD